MANSKFQHSLAPHQLYVLQLLALPADVQVKDFLYESDSVPDGLFIYWMIAFTRWYEIKGDTSLTCDFQEDIIELNDKLQKVYWDEETWDEASGIWSNDAFPSSPFWGEVRTRAQEILSNRGIELEKPDPSGWYVVLPEDLH